MVGEGHCRRLIVTGDLNTMRQIHDWGLLKVSLPLFIFTEILPRPQVVISSDDGLSPDSILICRITRIGNPILEIRRSHDRLIFTMGFLILVRRNHYIESRPWFTHNCTRQSSRGLNELSNLSQQNDNLLIVLHLHLYLWFPNYSRIASTSLPVHMIYSRLLCYW